MQMRDIILLAITVAAVIIIVRTIMYMPLMQRAVETFIGGNGPGTPSNNLTECPPNSQIYMYDGIVYCCEGIIDPDATTVQRSCKAAAGASDRMICTLGPGRGSIPNCLQTKAGQMQEQGQDICPPTLPNFCQGSSGSATANGRCCAGQPNAAYTDCDAATASGNYCDVSGDTTGKNIEPNFFLVPTDCRFLRAAVLELPNCPANYSHSTTISGGRPFPGATLIGCTPPLSSNQPTCFTTEIINQLSQFYPAEATQLVNCNKIPASS